MAQKKVATSRISELTVRGFKSINDEQRIEIRPLTILAGANSSGKSSMIQPLLLLKQTLETQGEPVGALQIDGTNVRFTLAEQLLHKKSAKEKPLNFSIEIGTSDKKSVKFLFRRKEGVGFEVERNTFQIDSKVIDVTPEMTHEKIMDVLPDDLKKFSLGLNKKEPLNLKWIVHRDRFFLYFALSDAGKPKNVFNFGSLDGLPRFELIRELQRIIHLRGLRGNPTRTYSKSSAGPMYPGTFEQYTASIIANWQYNHDDRMGNLSEMLEEMGLTWKVLVTPIADTQYELKVGRLLHSRKGGARDMVSIADVGFGVSQTLPVLVALLAASEGQLVYLEQPEIHLHPNAQRKLAHMLLKATSRGAVVVVETHSSLLLREIQTLVAGNLLSGKDVILHWFQRCEDGSSKVVSAELDENGAFGDWPEDFDKTELESESNYLDAVEARRAKK